MNKEKVEKRIDKITDYLNNKFEYISLKKRSYSKTFKRELFDDLSDKEFDIVCNELINREVKQIISCANKEFLKETFYDVLDTIDIRCNPNKKEDFEIEQSEFVIYDILRKYVSNENRTIDYPINLKYLKEYSISYEYNDNQVKTILKWIVIHLFIIEHFLKRWQS